MQSRRCGRCDFFGLSSPLLNSPIFQVCVFSSDESPARIAQSPRYVIESSDDESQSESDIEEITRHGSFECFDNLNHDPISFTPIVYEPWLVSNRSHKLHSLTFPTVTLDSLSLSPSKSNTILSPSSMTIPPSGYTSKQPQRLTVSILIRNIAYSKYVIVRFTTDGWKSFQDLEASFQGVVIPITTSAPGVDRFTAIIDLDKLSPPVPAKYGSVYENGHDYEHNVLQFEFAVCGRVNGNEFWDNNCGRNHKLVLQRTIRLMPLMSAATVALMTASKGALKTVEAVIEAAQKAAVQSAYAVAEEAKAIDRAFEQSSSYRRSSLPSPHTLGIETVEFQPVRAQINPQAADAVGSPFVTLKPGILSLTSSSSFSDDDDCDDQDTIAATTVALDIPAYYSDWAFGAIQAEATCVELGCDSDSVTGIDQSSIQRPAQYQSDTLHSLLSRAGSPVSSEVTAFPSSFYHHHQQHLINHGQIVLHHGQQHHQQQQQQQNYIPPKNDPKSHVQTRPLKLETLQTGTSFKRDSSPIVESVPAERVSGSPAIQDVNSSKLLRQNRSSEFAQPQFPAQYLPQQQLQQRKHNGTSDSLEEVWNDTAEDMKHIIDRKVMESIEGWSLWERK
ncbi:putative phosphatase regulatory subunit-domain-containing protein [Chytriomyces cf. hyalinus JEL632]|nr:putative phosphatase regulatory subunit-domain-containing protein [Chytriomyces cf. hyalinus JEL632]